MEESYCLFELNEYIRRFVALNLPTAVWVSAELASVDERKGHYYLNLIEKSDETDQLVAQGNAVMWQSSAKRWQKQNRMLLTDLLQAGRKVKLMVQAEFHERYGLKFMVLDIDPNYTLGQLEQQRQRTIETLEEQGLLHINSSLPLPEVPQRLAVISSPAAAGLQDFLQQLSENTYGYKFEIQFFPAAVQGPQTSTEIRRQLRTISRRATHYDAIVIIRGGGSRTDLAGFDELELCIAAAQMPLPIISGIGHETDQSVMDMLVHTAQKTPTAAATFLVERLGRFEEGVLRLELALRQVRTHYLQAAANQLLQKEERLGLLAQQQLQRQSWQLQQYEQQLPQLSQRCLKSATDKLEQLTDKHQLLRLETSLTRGFSVVSKAGTIINSKSTLQADDVVDIDFLDGRQTIKVSKT